MSYLVIASSHDLAAVERPVDLRQRVSVDLRDELHVLALPSGDRRELREELRRLRAAGLALRDGAVRSSGSRCLSGSDGSRASSDSGNASGSRCKMRALVL